MYSVFKSAPLNILKLKKFCPISSMPLSDFALFRQKFDKANHIVFLTGAGVSAESGVPTFRGDGGLWRTYSAPRYDVTL
jgi:hypothetical protein